MRVFGLEDFGHLRYNCILVILLALGKELDFLNYHDLSLYSWLLKEEKYCKVIMKPGKYVKLDLKSDTGLNSLLSM